MARMPYIHTCDLVRPVNHVDYLTRYAVNIPCRVIPLLTETPGILPLSNRAVYITMDSIPNQPSVTQLGNQYLTDYGWGDLIAVPSGGPILYAVLWVETIIWGTQAQYWRAICDTPGAGNPLSVNASHGRVQYDANDSFVVPAGVTIGYCECWGGGGSGHTSPSCPGGGGGAYAAGYITMVPGATMNCTISGGPPFVDFDGFELIVSAESGGVFGDALYPLGGQAANSFGARVFSGGDGGIEGGGVGSNTGGGGGGGGSASPFGPGGAGGNGIAGVGGVGGVGRGNGSPGCDNGGAGAVPGGAPGGGSGGSSETANTNIGAPGRIVLTW